MNIFCEPRYVFGINSGLGKKPIRESQPQCNVCHSPMQPEKKGWKCDECGNTEAIK